MRQRQARPIGSRKRSLISDGEVPGFVSVEESGLRQPKPPAKAKGHDHGGERVGKFGGAEVLSKLSIRNRQLEIVTISARTISFSTIMRPTVIGNLNLRGPALPGLKYSTPLRSSCFGM